MSYTRYTRHPQATVCVSSGRDRVCVSFSASRKKKIRTFGATRLYTLSHELPAMTALAQHTTHSHSGHDEKKPTVTFAGGIRNSYSCGCAPGTCELLFNAWAAHRAFVLVLNKLVHRSTNTDLGSTTSAPRGGDIQDKEREVRAGRFLFVFGFRLRGWSESRRCSNRASRANEHGNDFISTSAVEKDSLIASLRQ